MGGGVPEWQVGRRVDESGWFEAWARTAGDDEYPDRITFTAVPDEHGKPLAFDVWVYSDVDGEAMVQLSADACAALIAQVDLIARGEQ